MYRMKILDRNIFPPAMLLVATFCHLTAVQPSLAGTFTTTIGSLHVPRQFHTTTLLLNGKALVAGGQGVNGETNSAELYDPATGTSTVISPMNTARFSHAATLLLDGRVLVT